MFDEDSMPAQCPECGAWVDMNDMVDTTGKLCYHALVCEDCYENLESDD